MKNRWHITKWGKKKKDQATKQVRSHLCLLITEFISYQSSSQKAKKEKMDFYLISNNSNNTSVSEQN